MANNETKPLIQPVKVGDAMSHHQQQPSDAAANLGPAQPILGRLIGALSAPSRNFKPVGNAYPLAHGLALKPDLVIETAWKV